MPYFKCPNCHVRVHLASSDSAEVACSRCRAQLQPEPTQPTGEQLSGLIGLRADKPSPGSSS
jgi:transcription initiation factor IIE alpha subunit